MLCGLFLDASGCGRQPAGDTNETHFSAQQFEAQAHPRFPCAHGYESRSTRSETPSRQRSGAPDAVRSRTSPRSLSATVTTERFTRSFRLTTPSQFRFVFNKPVRSRDAFFTVLGRSSEHAHARLGLAVSRKTDKRAVMRNRLKRLIRESFRHHRLPVLDIVVITQPSAAKATNDELRSSLKRHWRRLDSAARRHNENRDSNDTSLSRG